LAEPERDEPRLIYADWLQQREDPRGTFIQLELALRQGPQVQGKRDELLKRERQALLGPLCELAVEVSFDRGLPDEVRVNLRPLPHGEPSAELRARLVDPRWRTVRKLLLPRSPSWQPRPGRKLAAGPASILLQHAPLDSLVHLDLSSVDDWASLASRPRPLPARSVSVDDEHVTPSLCEELVELVLPLPQLRGLSMVLCGREGPLLPTRIFRNPLFCQLERLDWGVPNGPLPAVDEWLALLRSAGSPLRRLTLPGRWALTTLQRADDGRYHVHVTLAEALARPEESVFRSLPAEHVASFEATGPGSVVLTRLARGAR
jgi:uncharacterized protein (TIGR02996 family)